MSSKISHKSLISSIISAAVIAGLSLSILSSPSSAEVAAIIIVTPTEGLITDENGGYDSFTIVLDGPPTHPVKITLETSDPTEGTVSSSSVSLNKNNWNTPREIVVIGLTDGIQDGDIDYQITGLSSSTDPDFDGLVMPAVSVTNLNDAIPVAIDDSSTTKIDTPVIIDVLVNDTALDDVPLSLTIENSTSNGGLVINLDNTFTYSPELSFIGGDEFSYQICDIDEDCATASVIITVAPNNVLFAVDDRYSVGQDNPLNVEAPGVLDNDIDPDNKVLQAIKLSDPSFGQLDFFHVDGDFKYNPYMDFIGVDTFTYIAFNGTDESDPATVIIEVLDQTPPSIEWISPAQSGGVYDVSGDEVYLQVEASDNFQVNCIEFFHWDAKKTEFVLLGIDCDIGYGITVESGELNYGWNQIFARADDVAGNLSEFKHIWLYRMAVIYLPLIER
jgi:hypothetical protein